MKRYQFNLAALLRVRNVELSLANQNIAATSQQIANRERKIANLKSHYEATLAGAENSSSLIYHEQAARIYKDIFSLQQEVTQLQEVLYEQKILGIEQKKKVEILENLNNQRYIAWLHEYNKEETLLLDEIGSTQALLRSYNQNLQHRKAKPHGSIKLTEKL